MITGDDEYRIANRFGMSVTLRPNLGDYGVALGDKIWLGTGCKAQFPRRRKNT